MSVNYFLGSISRSLKEPWIQTEELQLSSRLSFILNPSRIETFTFSFDVDASMLYDDIWYTFSLDRLRRHAYPHDRLHVRSLSIRPNVLGSFNYQLQPPLETFLSLFDPLEVTYSDGFGQEPEMRCLTPVLGCDVWSRLERLSFLNTVPEPLFPESRRLMIVASQPCVVEVRIISDEDSERCEAFDNWFSTETFHYDMGSWCTPFEDYGYRIVVVGRWARMNFFEGIAFAHCEGLTDDEGLRAVFDGVTFEGSLGTRVAGSEVFLEYVEKRGAGLSWVEEIGEEKVDYEQGEEDMTGM